MVPSEFKSWRKALGLKQKEVAEKLGLKKRIIQYYETGSRGSKKVAIPRTVELACYALSAGIEKFDGDTTGKSKNGAGRKRAKPASKALSPKPAATGGRARGRPRKTADDAAEGASKGA